MQYIHNFGSEHRFTFHIDDMASTWYSGTLSLKGIFGDLVSMHFSQATSNHNSMMSSHKFLFRVVSIQSFKCLLSGLD